MSSDSEASDVSDMNESNEVLFSVANQSTSQTNITCQFGRAKGRTFFEPNSSVLKAEKAGFARFLSNCNFGNIF